MSVFLVTQALSGQGLSIRCLPLPIRKHSRHCELICGENFTLADVQEVVNP